MSIPSHPVDDWYQITTRIRDRGGGRATGFFFKEGDESYLITNKHVVDKESINGRPLQETRIFIRQDSNDLADLSYYDLNLVEDGDPAWLTYPGDHDIDVIALPLRPPIVESEIDIDLFTNEDAETGSLALSKADTRPDPVKIIPGQQVMILGYPIETNPPHWPIVRNGLISTPYGEKVERNPYFLVDARMHPGTSGSPVLTLPSGHYYRIGDRDGNVDTPHPYLLGIHSGDYRYETIVSDADGPLDLNPVWYAEIIEEIVKRDQVSSR